MKRVFIVACCLLLLPFITEAQFTVEPTSTPSDGSTELVDIIIEADTMKPSFYKGRSEPSIGSTIRAVAVLDGIAHVASYSYRWEVENTVIDGGPVVGQNMIVFTAPPTNQFRIQVHVFNASGNMIASTQRYITLSKPVVAFYEANPLRGILEVAIQDNYVLTGEEVSVRAEPYFVNKNILSSNYDLSWHIDGREVSNPTTDPQVITLRNNGGSGTFAIDFSLRNLSSLMQYVQNRFTLSF